jgi:hypothetical protein
MSTLLGTLHLTGSGGSELFVYDDCLVRATTGLAASLSGGQSVSPADPVVLVNAHEGNRMVRRADIRDAVLARGRWPMRGLRRLELHLHSGTVVQYDWAGDNATHALNADGYATDLLTRALHELLEVRLTT